MKDILLFVHDDAGMESRLRAAIDMVRAVDGHLICANLIQYPVVAVVDPIIGSADAMLLTDARDRADAVRAKTEAHLRQENMQWTWHEGLGDLPALLAEAGALADLIVMNVALSADIGPDMAMLVGDVVMRCGTPVLAVPQDWPRFNPRGDALIAWNGSAPLLETVSSCLSLLQAASSVTLLELGPIRGAPAEDGLQRLAHHGIAATLVREELSGRKAQVALEEACKLRQPAYCLMGAYGHSRLREQLFGGVTTHMLDHAPVPLVIGQ